MSEEFQRQRADAHGSEASSPRTDFRTRDVVNQAIAAMPTLGVQQAAEYLAAMNVPPEVAIRTLIYKGPRRDEP
ncbi:hypothetical protein CR152_28525 [Massilia violaceinigra]|uniref:Uncharacterized protein n=1 Tax=Massilia violaceinigra TaxID=2045208 RepID=A0A2D2DSR8_9BURK|nr:hypothetical protein [Massilia violaceinigra]ATQ78014.1 hypothetical protein CR152_28525 [Massilia violaceinigra]